MARIRVASMGRIQSRFGRTAHELRDRPLALAATARTMLARAPRRQAGRPRKARRLFVSGRYWHARLTQLPDTHSGPSRQGASVPPQVSVVVEQPTPRPLREAHAVAL